MELRQLEYVVVLADELSFRRAAEHLAIAQSGLSQQVKRLERELGVALFDRSTHHVALTPAGTAFVREARRTLESAQRARQAAAGHAPGGNRLRVCVGSAQMDTIPTALAELERRHPGLEVTTLDGGLARQRQLLDSGELDVGLALLDGDPGPGLAARLLRREPIGVVMGEQHRFTGTDQVPWADIDEEALAVAGREHPEYNAFLADVLDEVGARPDLVECADVPAALQAVRDDGRLLCVPELPLLPPELVWRPLVEPVVSLPSSLVWRRHDARPVVRRFLDVATTTARARGWLT